MVGSWLDRQRATVVSTCAGTDPALAAEAPLAASPGMTIGGVVSYLRWLEYHWFEAVLLGRPAPGPGGPESPDAAWRIGAERPLAALIDEYAGQCARSRQITARLEPGSAARRAPGGSRPTLRWVLLHMVEETARRNGHLDLLRELAEGAKAG